MGWCVVLMQNPPVSSQSWPLPSHIFTQFSEDFNVIVLTDSLATGNPLCHHNTLDIEENNQHCHELQATHATLFFALGEFGDFQCIDCRFVSGSYINIQVSSQVIIDFNKSGSFTLRYKRSEQISF